jgi:GNAT superfamily N-acetyltransferase
MNLAFAIATRDDAAELAALHRAVADRLVATFGKGPWGAAASMKGAWFSAKNLRVVVVRKGRRIVGTLDLHTRKPWAIDASYFTPVKTPLYLTNMAVLPTMQRKGIGRELLEEAVEQAYAWPADAIRLDAFDAAAGAGGFYAACGFREVGRTTYRKVPLIYFEHVLAK